MKQIGRFLSFLLWVFRLPFLGVGLSNLDDDALGIAGIALMPEDEDCEDFVGDPDDLTPEQVAEIRAGIARGLEAAAAGRVKSLAQAVAEARQRHGFPASWAENIDKPRTML